MQFTHIILFLYSSLTIYESTRIAFPFILYLLWAINILMIQPELLIVSFKNLIWLTILILYVVLRCQLLHRYQPKIASFLFLLVFHRCLWFMRVACENCFLVYIREKKTINQNLELYDQHPKGKNCLKLWFSVLYAGRDVWNICLASLVYTAWCSRVILEHLLLIFSCSAVLVTKRLESEYIVCLFGHSW